MYNQSSKTTNVRKKRKMRVRKHVRGTSIRPRLSVYRTNCNISAQIIDDEEQKTLVSYGTLCKDIKNTEQGKKTKTSARAIGEKLAKLAIEKQIEFVVFDRGPYKYHGIIAELAEGARSAGLKF
ncbi:MAG: 50S ribosomal protein L18 [Simkaniaceae bacterium]